MTTGLFPHEILIDLKSAKSLSDVKCVTSNGIYFTFLSITSEKSYN